MPIVLSPENEALLEQLPEPKLVWKYMLALTQIPRGSNMQGETENLKAVLAFLKQRAEELGCETIVDPADNLIIRRKAYPGYEDKPGICLQGHMDMVCQKRDDVEIDFKKDPIKARIVDGEYLMATGTSLGADNGIGVALGFAMLEDADLKCGPLEVLITRDEEVGLVGANLLEPNSLRSKYLINVDSEEMSAVCVGCAGSFSLHMTLPAERDSKLELGGYVARTVVLNDFVGGHSGTDIHLGRAHPLPTMGRLLLTLEDLDYRVCKLECGTARNAIPRKCVVELLVPADSADDVGSRLAAEFACFRKEYETIEKTATFQYLPSEKASMPPTTAPCTRACVAFMNMYPFGVMRMSPAKQDFVETSTNCGISAMDTKGNFVFTASVRSSSSSQLTFMFNKIVSLTNLLGMNISAKFGVYPGWEPKLESPLTKAMVGAFTEVEGKEPKVYAIHAGLECGVLLEKCPYMDCTSIGPDINFPHSPDERMRIATVAPCAAVLKSCVEKLCA